MKWVDLVNRLHAEGLVSDPSIKDPLPPAESRFGQWLSMIGAWVAAFFLLGFVLFLALPVFQYALSNVLLGAGCLALGVGLGRAGLGRSQIMANQLALLSCVFGGVMLGFGFVVWGFQREAYLALAVVCVPCFLLTREQNQRQLFAMAAMLLLCIYFARHRWTVSTWVLSVALTIALVAVQDRWVVRGQGERFNAMLTAVGLTTLLTPVFMSSYGSIAYILYAPRDAFVSDGFFSGDLGWASLGAISALTVGAAGYRTGLVALRRFAVVALLCYGYMFYFTVGTTLLHKAYALFFSGAVLLLFSYWTSSKVNVQDKSQ